MAKVDMELILDAAHSDDGMQQHTTISACFRAKTLACRLQVVEKPVPDELLAQAAEKRSELIEAVANADEEVAELFLEEAAVDGDTLAAAIRRSTIRNEFFPVFMGSAYKNVGVQLLLDGVRDYLPDPTEVH